jgi:hypothetical protein
LSLGRGKRRASCKSYAGVENTPLRFFGLDASSQRPYLVGILMAILVQNYCVEDNEGVRKILADPSVDRSKHLFDLFSQLMIAKYPDRDWNNLQLGRNTYASEAAFFDWWRSACDPSYHIWPTKWFCRAIIKFAPTCKDWASYFTSYQPIKAKSISFWDRTKALEKTGDLELLGTKFLEPETLSQ